MLPDYQEKDIYVVVEPKKEELKVKLEKCFRLRVAGIIKNDAVGQEEKLYLGYSFDKDKPEYQLSLFPNAYNIQILTLVNHQGELIHHTYVGNPAAQNKALNDIQLHFQERQKPSYPGPRRVEVEFKYLNNQAIYRGLVLGKDQKKENHFRIRVWDTTTGHLKTPVDSLGSPQVRILKIFFYPPAGGFPLAITNIPSIGTTACQTFLYLQKALLNLFGPANLYHNPLIAGWYPKQRLGLDRANAPVNYATHTPSDSDYVGGKNYSSYLYPIETKPSTLRIQGDEVGAKIFAEMKKTFPGPEALLSLEEVEGDMPSTKSYFHCPQKRIPHNSKLCRIRDCPNPECQSYRMYD